MSKQGFLVSQQVIPLANFLDLCVFPIRITQAYDCTQSLDNFFVRHFLFLNDVLLLLLCLLKHMIPSVAIRNRRRTGGATAWIIRQICVQRIVIRFFSGRIFNRLRVLEQVRAVVMAHRQTEEVEKAKFTMLLVFSGLVGIGGNCICGRLVTGVVDIELLSDESDSAWASGGFMMGKVCVEPIDLSTCSMLLLKAESFIYKNENEMLK
jgi:hypothetical protein